MNETRPRILLTGASGYIGGRLLRRLESADYSIRCLARKPEYLEPRVGPHTEIVAGDVLDAPSLIPALADIDVAFYLVHSMGSKGSFVEEDRQAARNFTQAAEAAGVSRIIYLGGLGDDSKQLSAHLASRHETGEVLRQSQVPVIEFRASIVIGSGSLSFEMVRSLVEKLPVMTTPRWVYVEAQPIYIDDLLAYLLAAIELESSKNELFEIGGDDRVTYGDLMQAYAKLRGLKRLIIPVPILTPWISSLWLGLITPLFARIGRKLIDSLRHPSVVNDPRAREVFDIHPRSTRQAMADALAAEESDLRDTRWCDAMSSSGPIRTWNAVHFGRRLMDSRSREVAVPPAQAFAPIQRLGGESGYYYANFLWKIRAAIDVLVGGVGLGRRRRDAVELQVGDTVDWWRVEQFEPGKVLRLEAEMKMPGRAWLQFEVEKTETGSRILQTALFDPVGLGGRLYWYAVYPLHLLVFRGMLRGIAKAALRS
ncbi:MAG: hypothetical protein ACI9TH_003907 [Kiritimatiellia bacterium]